MARHAKALLIDWVSVQGHYDVNLSGWVRIAGERYRFECRDPFAKKLVYDLFDTTDRAVKLSEMRGIREFRLNVYWRWERAPNREYSLPQAALRPGHMEWLKRQERQDARAERHAAIKAAPWTKVGESRDYLRTARL